MWETTHAPVYTDAQLDFLTWYNLNCQYFFYAAAFGLILLLAAFNLASRLLWPAFIRRYHSLHPRNDAPGKRYLDSAALASWRKWTYRRSQAVVWMGLGSAAQLCVVLGYITVTVGIAMAGAYGHPDFQAHHCARLCYAHIPLLVAFASKDLGIMRWITGCSPSTLTSIHRWMGRIVFFLACYHVFGRIYVNVPTIDPSLHGMSYQGWGELQIAGLILWTIMVVGALRPIRRTLYKSFIFTHIGAFVLSIICLSLHIPRVAAYLVAGVILYMADRLARFASIAYWNLFRQVAPGQGPSVRVEVLSKEAVKVHISTATPWKPGSHIYFHAPLLEAGGHPFSVASTYLPVSHLDSDATPRSSSMTLVIRVHDGLTHKLYDHVLKNRGDLHYSAGDAKSFSQHLWPAFTEGPYGHNLLLHHYESVILVAGGTGVTFALPYLLDLVRRARNKHLGGSKPLVTTRVTFIWTVRHAADVEWIGTELREALFYAPPGFLDLQVHLTASPRPPSDMVNVTFNSLEYTQTNESEFSVATKADYSTATRVLLNNPSQEILLPSHTTRTPSILSHHIAPDSARARTPPPAPRSFSFEPTSSQGSTLAPTYPPTHRPSPSTDELDAVHIPTRHGRPRIRDILADVVAHTARSGSIAVGTCGPVAMTDEVGAACSDIIDVAKVRHGEHRLNVMLHSEVFGW
ncbi:ferric-chelate reductase Frp1 [Rhodotorula kratochvilovae]